MKNLVLMLSFTFGLLLLSSSGVYANASELIRVYPNEKSEIAFQGDLSNISYPDVSNELGMIVDEAVVDAIECCGTCTVTFSLLGFVSFSYSWCCNKCKNEQ